MKKGIKIFLIVIIITIFIVLTIFSFFIYKYSMMSKNYNWCLFDSDCIVGHNMCSCNDYCSNKVLGMDVAQCIKTKEECDKLTNRTSIGFCECSKNKCVQGFLKD